MYTPSQRLEIDDIKRIINRQSILVDHIVLYNSDLQFVGGLTYPKAEVGDKVAILTQELAGIYTVLSDSTLLKDDNYNTLDKLNNRFIYDKVINYYKVEVTDGILRVIRQESGYVEATQFIKSSNLEGLNALSNDFKNENYLYCTTNDNKLFRYKQGSTTTVSTPDVTDLDIQNLLDSADATVSNVTELVEEVTNGASNIIKLLNGNYQFTENFVVNRPVVLIGEDKNSVIISDTRTSSQNFFIINSSNVVVANLTVDHPSNDTGIDHAITIVGLPSGTFKDVESNDYSNDDTDESYDKSCKDYFKDLCDSASRDVSWQQTRINNVRLDNVIVLQGKGGISIFGGDIIVNKCNLQITYSSGTRRHILLYGNAGRNIIVNNSMSNSVGANVRSIYLTSTTGSNPNETVFGELVIKNNVLPDATSQFINIDNHQQAEGQKFTLTVDGNQTTEDNAFIVLFGVVNGFGDMYEKIILMNNDLNGKHNDTGTKGIFGIDGLAGISFRTDTNILPIISDSNSIGITNFRDGWVEAIGSTGAVAGSSTNITNVSVQLQSATTTIASEFIHLNPIDIPDEFDYLSTALGVKSYFSSKKLIIRDFNYTGTGIDIEDVSGFVYEDIKVDPLYREVYTEFNNDSDVTNPSVILPDYNDPELRVTYGTVVDSKLSDLLVNFKGDLEEFINNELIVISNRRSKLPLKIKAPTGISMVDRLDPTNPITEFELDANLTCTIQLNVADNGSYIYSVTKS